jgi:hypothetical protein
MKRFVLVPLAAALVAALVPAAALAKGASEAEIMGPGLEEPISLPGEGQPGGEQLMQIAEAIGFFPAVFSQSPDPMLDRRPAGALGPRYRITYVMPGPNNELDELVQDVYPYAEPFPVSYTKPGQRFWTTERTRGGWYVAHYSSLKEDLVAAGLPESPPSFGGDGGGWPTAVVIGTVVTAAVALLALLVALLRRPQTKTVTASRSAS